MLLYSCRECKPAGDKEKDMYKSKEQILNERKGTALEIDLETPWGFAGTLKTAGTVDSDNTRVTLHVMAEDMLMETFKVTREKANEFLHGIWGRHLADEHANQLAKDGGMQSGEEALRAAVNRRSKRSNKLWWRMINE